MAWDNVLLNINGKSDDDLISALRLSFAMHSSGGARGYIKHREKGLILLWYTGADKDAHEFPSKLSADQVMPMVTAYLGSEDAVNVELEHWESDADHDGHNSAGWRVYAEDWGHVVSSRAICAVKRVFLWHGK